MPKNCRLCRYKDNAHTTRKKYFELWFFVLSVSLYRSRGWRKRHTCLRRKQSTQHWNCRWKNWIVNQIKLCAIGKRRERTRYMLGLREQRCTTYGVCERFTWRKRGCCVGENVASLSERILWELNFLINVLYASCAVESPPKVSQLQRLVSAAGSQTRPTRDYKNPFLNSN